MNLWIMDTDYLSQLQRGDQRILEHLAQIKPPSIGITIITVEEQIRGRLAKIRQLETMKNQREMILAYQNLRVTGILLTRNDRDFSQISNLNIEKF